MIRASIHRNEYTDRWVVLVTDTIREKRQTIECETLTEAEETAKKAGADKVRIAIGN